MEAQELISSLIPLYYIQLAGGVLSGRIRLQKLVFLLQMKSPQLPINYQFEKNDYGPFSPKLHDVVENLVSMGFLKEKTGATPSGNTVISYRLTTLGISLLNIGRKQKLLPSEVAASAKEIYKDYGTMRFIDLIKRVYGEYPVWAEKSVFFSNSSRRLYN